MPNLKEIMGNVSIANLWENMNIYEHGNSINGTIYEYIIIL